MRILFLTLFLVLTPRLQAQDTPAAGFSLTPQPYPGATPFSAVTTLASGDLLVFDGLKVVQYTDQGAFVQQLGSASSFVFPSFLVLDPAEQFVLLGESTLGGVYLLPLFGDPPVHVATLPLNYDAAMRDSRVVYVSAATCGFGCGNVIWSIDLETRQTTVVARVAGASGPLALDESGNLFYGTASSRFPPPPHSSAILEWSAQQLAAGTVLGQADALLVGGGFSGAARMLHDSESGALFLAENDFGTGENRIRRVLGAATVSPIVVEGRPFLSVGNLGFRSTPHPAAFLPHQPKQGGTLTYTTTDFGSLVERAALEPLRPTVVVSGPGTSGPGNFDLTLQNGPHSGFARVLVCPRTLFHSRESMWRGFLASPLRPHLQTSDSPLFFGLDQANTVAVPGLLGLDAQGRVTQTYFNPGGYVGQFAIQLLLYDAHRNVVGTSAVAFL